MNLCQVIYVKKYYYYPIFYLFASTNNFKVNKINVHATFFLDGRM